MHNYLKLLGIDYHFVVDSKFKILAVEFRKEHTIYKITLGEGSTLKMDAKVALEEAVCLSLGQVLADLNSKA